MSLRPQFTEYRLKVADRSNYPDAPDWVREELLERIDTLLALEDGDQFEYTAAWFSRGAARYITDQCGSECDELLDDMPRVS